MDACEISYFSSQGIDFIPVTTTWVALLAGGGVYDDKVLNKDKTFFV